ncbi:MAG: molybdopterin-dependent oxidoreductase [Candidatus Thorarchaeota archaeon]|jgi:predicted molibdopterin-dependent oxidoreductase YjgC
MPTIFIDGKKVQFEDDVESVLDVARSTGIQIPTLCDHPELEAHGGCRMCLVEIEGWRGYVASCTTPPKDGMVVTTSSEDLTRMKRNILQLILREHPSACVVCYEWPDCLQYRTEIHRAGSVTGCNTCPNREDCELREVAELLDIKDLDYQPEYKRVPVERNDPFFDRDYNLCILCARCVRICDEVRGTSAITLTDRGYGTRVDTAFGTSHIDSGCWFCGACVDVCPTGAITPRISKWIGTPDETVETTCTLCSIGCQMQLDLKWERVMGTSPGRIESPPNHGHMCVLGRFCVPSLINAPDRLKTPHVKQADVDIPVSWDDALSEVTRILTDADPEKVGFLGSPHISSESAYLLHKLARAGVKSANVDFQGSDFVALIHKELAVDEDFARIKTLESLGEVDWILSIGGDFVKTHQVVAKAVYNNVKVGIPLIVIGESGDNLHRWASEYVPAPQKKIPSIVEKLSDHEVKIPGIDSAQAQRLVDITKNGKGAILIGQRILEFKDPRHILRALVRLAGEDGAQYPLFPYGNETGVMKAGLRPEMLPGPSSITEKKATSQAKKAWGEANLTDGLHLIEMREKARKGEIEVLYILDGSISIKGFEKVPTIIYQSPFPSDWIEKASVILPSAAFVEENGTFVNFEMKPLEMKAAVKSPGTAREDWQIIADIGKKMGASGFEFKKVGDVWEELSRFTREIETGGQPRRTSWKPAPADKHEWYPRYRGASLPERIQDLATFIEALPDRDKTQADESLDELLERLEKAKEASN